MSFDTPQVATLWTLASRNSTGGSTWNPGELIDVRVADANSIVYGADGKQRHATREYYSYTAMLIGAKIIEGNHEGVVVPVKGSQLILQDSSNSSYTTFHHAVV